MLKLKFLLVFCLICSATNGVAGDFDPNIYIALGKKVIPSVVNISSLTNGRGGNSMRGGPPEEYFRRFFEEFLQNSGGGMRPKQDGMYPRAMALGTGFIVDSEGLILTNNHVVADADEIKILFTEDEGEKPTPGDVVGRDPELDLALIRVKTNRTLVPLVLGDSDTLQVGEYVAAVGNPMGHGHSMTHGIISAKDRKAPDFQLAKYLQTDAPINPGNSGGPLVNLRGEVIGINNAIDQSAQGIGFAIPSQLIKAVLPQLKSKGSVSRGYVGILVGDVTPEVAAQMKLGESTRGALVTQVNIGEPADKAGLRPYDLILEVKHEKIKNSGELIHAITALTVGEKVPVKVLRSGKEVTLSIVAGQRPNGAVAKRSSPSKKKRPQTGLYLEELTPEIRRELSLRENAKGVLVDDVEEDSPAERAGFFRDDVIIEVDRKEVNTVERLESLLNTEKSLLVRVRRLDAQGKELFAVLVLDLKER